MTIDPDAPWQANMVLLFLIAIVPATFAFILNERRTRRVEAKTDRVEAKTDIAVENLQNSHSSNLREDLDRQFQEVRQAIGNVADGQEALRVDISGVHSELRDVHGDIGHIRTDVNGVRADARRNARRIGRVERAVEKGQEILEKHHPGSEELFEDGGTS